MPFGHEMSLASELEFTENDRQRQMEDLIDQLDRDLLFKFQVHQLIEQNYSGFSNQKCRSPFLKQDNSHSMITVSLDIFLYYRKTNYTCNTLTFYRVFVAELTSDHRSREVIKVSIIALQERVAYLCYPIICSLLIG